LATANTFSSFEKEAIENEESTKKESKGDGKK
jgi:hypothetical protein